MRRGSWIVGLALTLGASLAADEAVGEPLEPTHESPALALMALDRRVANVDAETETTKKAMAELGPKLADVHARVLARGRALYRLTRLGMLPLGGGFDELVTHAMRVERARRSLQGELAVERGLRTRGADLARNLERLAQDKNAFTTQRQAMDAARAASADDSRRRDAFERAFESSTGASEYVAIYGGNNTDPVAIGGFSGSRGRLLFPVLGRAEVRTGKREGEGSSGLEIRAPLGATVRAVFAGRVSFSDRYGSYGRIVILDHGERYYTVSGNLGSVDVRVGDEVSAGERIGAVGDEGQGPLLYFELRHGSQAIPAGPWLGVERSIQR
jgi:murein DD-endopeptidase MepM/ murein hydrolase activator NlpD